jgi:hypothetical protein
LGPPGEVSGRELSPAERAALKAVLDREDRATTVFLHGHGEGRVISFYAVGTWVEAHIAYPEVPEVTG